ncbi:MAG TPA: archaetidylserine decarboxylase [Gammaproteobacteria bacterium]|jgi:phosphatidylserine decarboxylase|nr:archaetidylserine decarboxylase [Gammaproteobacteria bacterium]
MKNQLFIYLQYCLPQHLLSHCLGWLAESRVPWLKNFLIINFIKLYHIDLNEAEITDPKAYLSFNQFFTRQLKLTQRPIASEPDGIVSPVDGTIAQIGRIHKNQLLQAKQCYFDLESLFAGDTALASDFQDGAFTTIYLAPNNYHRVHMPVAGQLIKTVYVPGKLFSVNRITTELLPQLYSRNERLITVFNTPMGPMAVILVGALIVGSIQTVWMKQPIRDNHTSTAPDNLMLAKGAELGHFKMGSTVLLLFGKDKIQWLEQMQSNKPIRLGELLGKGEHTLAVRDNHNE